MYTKYLRSNKSFRQVSKLTNLKQRAVGQQLCQLIYQVMRSKKTVYKLHLQKELTNGYNRDSWLLWINKNKKALLTY